MTVGLGDDGSLVRAAQAAGFDGLVVQATSGGEVPPPMAQALEAAAMACPSCCRRL